jgi:hypothetical protein
MEKGGIVPAATKIDEIANFLTLSDEERADLFRLAEKIPNDVGQMLVREPEAASFYRAVNRMSDARRRAYLRNLVEELEREQQDPGRGTDEPYRGDDPGTSAAPEDDR